MRIHYSKVSDWVECVVGGHNARSATDWCYYASLDTQSALLITSITQSHDVVVLLNVVNCTNGAWWRLAVAVRLGIWSLALWTVHFVITCNNEWSYVQLFDTSYLICDHVHGAGFTTRIQLLIRPTDQRLISNPTRHYYNSYNANDNIMFPLM